LGIASEPVRGKQYPKTRELSSKANKEGFKRAAVRFSLDPAAKQVLGHRPLGIAFSTWQRAVSN
jgi:hypothetical protein